MSDYDQAKELINRLIESGDQTAKITPPEKIDDKELQKVFDAVGPLLYSIVEVGIVMKEKGLEVRRGSVLAVVPELNEEAGIKEPMAILAGKEVTPCEILKGLTAGLRVLADSYQEKDGGNEAAGDMLALATKQIHWAIRMIEQQEQDGKQG